jgi:hypothetical protein
MMPGNRQNLNERRKKMKWIAREERKGKELKQLSKKNGLKKDMYSFLDRRNNPHLYPVTWPRVTWLKDPEPAL